MAQITRSAPIPIPIQDLIAEIEARGYCLTLKGPESWSAKPLYRWEARVADRDGVTTGTTCYGSTAQAALSRAVGWIRAKQGDRDAIPG